MTEENKYKMTKEDMEKLIGLSAAAALFKFLCDNELNEIQQEMEIAITDDDKELISSLTERQEEVLNNKNRIIKMELVEENIEEIVDISYQIPSYVKRIMDIYMKYLMQPNEQKSKEE